MDKYIVYYRNHNRGFVPLHEKNELVYFSAEGAIDKLKKFVKYGTTAYAEKVTDEVLRDVNHMLNGYPMKQAEASDAA